MNMIVHKDLAERGGVTLNLNGGYDVERVFLVEKVPGNPDAIINNAIKHGEVPKPGQRHPSIPLIVVHSIKGKSMGSRQVELSITYKSLSGSSTTPDEEGQTQISIGASIQTVRTNKHIVIVKGKEVEKLIELEYSYPVGLAPDGVDTPKKVIATIDKQVPVVVATLSRTESEDAGQKAYDFVGRLNSKKFIGTPKGGWLCTDIRSNSSDSGVTYKVNYVFMRSQDGWNTDVAYSDEETGKIPVDVEDQEKALINVISQRSKDFGALKLGPFTST